MKFVIALCILVLLSLVACSKEGSESPASVEEDYDFILGECGDLPDERRASCCRIQHKDVDTSGCDGNWVYDEENEECKYKCDNLKKDVKKFNVTYVGDLLGYSVLVEKNSPCDTVEREERIQEKNPPDVIIDLYVVPADGSCKAKDKSTVVKGELIIDPAPGSISVNIDGQPRYRLAS